MDYRGHYDNLINRAKNRTLAGYYEKHHIIPKCVGGQDDSDNIIALTAREHFIAHQLLIKIYNNNLSLVKAANFMCSFSDEHGENRSKNRLYGWLREKLSVALSESQTGVGNSQYGSMWISNPDTNESIKIKTNEVIPTGFYKGRNIKWNECGICGTKHLLLNRRTCSEECMKESFTINGRRVGKMKIGRKKKHKLVCVVCDKEFEHTNKSKKCCSTECYDKSKILSSIKGTDKIKRKVIDDTGKIFNTLTEASRFYNITVEAIRYRIKTGKYQYMN